MYNLSQVARPRPTPIEIALAPAHNVLNSIALLNAVQRLPALDAWVVRTAAALTPEQRATNRLVFDGLGTALLPDHDWQDFPTYLDALAAQNPAELRDRIAERAADAPADAALAAEAQALLSDPQAMQELIVTHLRAIWNGTLAAEWKRVLPPLQKLVAIAQQRPEPEATTIAENLRAFIVGDACADADVRRIICIPSPHTGRYTTRMYHDGTLRLFFHGPSNYAVIMRSSEVGRAELLTRLASLADETRLRILELFAGQNELSAQEIMTRLELSQSSVSRHLKQLAPYIIERRGEGASKFYSLGPTQIDLTLHALQRMLAGSAADIATPQPEQSAYPRELKRFLDEHGRATAWPTKRRDQLLLLEYLAAQFELGRDYTEKEVNAVLIEHMHPIFKDYAIIRRELYSYRYLDRERDGSRYWRVAQPPVAVQEQLAY
jgi:DNA-binding MarR family transcriptional regulator